MNFVFAVNLQYLMGFDIGLTDLVWSVRGHGVGRGLRLLGREE